MKRGVLLWAWWLCAALALLTTTTTRGAFYSSGDHVVELDPSNFEREVTQSDALWLVEFYAPRCGHCQRLTPEWKRAAAALRGVAKVGAVDAERHGSLAGRYGVAAFPDIKVFGADKSAPPEEYRGGRGSRDIVDAALSAVRALVKDRLAGGGGKSTGSKGSGGGGSKGGSKGAARSGGASGSSGKNSDVVELTDGNFDQLVLQGGGGGGGGGGDREDVWMVQFFAPWCGHCKSLEPEWAAAATAVRERTGGKVRLGAVDATVHRGLAGRYDISGFPTIKIFRRGNPSESPEDYQGGRSRGEITAKAEELFEETPPPPEPLREILDEDVFGEACGGGGERQLCVVAVLPHILDSGAAGRNAYLELVRKAAEKQQQQRPYRRPAWGWLWAEAGAQPDLEEALGGVGSLGYPVMAAVNARKARAAVLRGSFGESGIGEFLAELSVAGRGGGGGSASAAAPVAGFTVPKIHRVEAWDGKDGQLPLVEEYELSNAEL